MTPTAALQLAESVVADGFAPHQEALADLLAEAYHRGVDPVVVGVVADPTEPTVARERALGRLIGQHRHLVEAGSVPCAEPCGATAA